MTFLAYFLKVGISFAQVLAADSKKMRFIAYGLFCLVCTIKTFTAVHLVFEDFQWEIGCDVYRVFHNTKKLTDLLDPFIFTFVLLFTVRAFASE